MRTRGVALLLGLWWSLFAMALLLVLSLSGCVADETHVGIAVVCWTGGVVWIALVVDVIRRRRRR